MPRKRTETLEQTEEVATAHEPGEDPSEHSTVPNPRPWANNNAAGIQSFTRTDPYEFLICFKEKPPQEVLNYLKGNGFAWNRADQSWARPIRYTTAAQDREIGRRTYRQAVDMLLEQQGVTAGQSQGEAVPF